MTPTRRALLRLSQVLFLVFLLFAALAAVAGDWIPCALWIVLALCQLLVIWFNRRQADRLTGSPRAGDGR